MSDKINSAKEIHEFTVKLVDKLYEEGLIDNKEVIPDEMRELIVEAIKVELIENKDNNDVDQIELIKD